MSMDRYGTNFTSISSWPFVRGKALFAFLDDAKKYLHQHGRRPCQRTDAMEIDCSACLVSLAGAIGYLCVAM